MNGKTALIELHDRLVESYNASPTEQGRELIAIAEAALLACEGLEKLLASGKC